MVKPFIESDWLERRRFECLCGKKATYQIYQRTNPYFLSCDCGKNFQFDWDTDKFINEAPTEFSLIEDDSDV